MMFYLGVSGDSEVNKRTRDSCRDITGTTRTLQTTQSSTCIDERPAVPSGTDDARQQTA